MDNSTSRELTNRTENLGSGESDNEKSKHSRKYSRGAWIMRHEIHQLRKDVSREIENERNPQQNDLNMLTYLIISYHQKKTLSNSQMTSMRTNF